MNKRDRKTNFSTWKIKMRSLSAKMNRIPDREKT